MSISLNYTTIDSADDKANWETVDNGSSIADSSYPPKEGSQCIEWEMSPNSSGGVRNANNATAYDCTVRETGVWFLNPVADNDGKLVIANQEDGIYLRLYSSSGC